MGSAPVSLSYEGKVDECWEIQDKFIEELHSAREAGENICSCKAKCKLHGKCVECVAVHRGHMDHLPNCFHDMVNQRLEAVAALTERSLKD